MAEDLPYSLFGLQIQTLHLITLVPYSCLIRSSYQMLKILRTASNADPAMALALSEIV